MVSKISEFIRSLKADAVPQAPSSEDSTSSETNGLNYENIEEIHKNGDNFKKSSSKKKEKPKKSFPKTHKKKDDRPEDKSSDDRRDSSSIVNTQAGGHVINIVNAVGFHWGDNKYFYMGPQNDPNQYSEEPKIEKCNLITLLMEAQIEPHHEYIDYTSKNLGRNWQSFFRRLGFTKGWIETVERDESKNGVSEARYQLLLEWVRNTDDATLGLLATQLWEEGEREVVKNLAIIYSKNNK